MLNDVFKSAPKQDVINLRYFNPVGAHPSGLIGEKSVGPFIISINRPSCCCRGKFFIFLEETGTNDGTEYVIKQSWMLQMVTLQP